MPSPRQIMGRLSGSRRKIRGSQATIKMRKPSPSSNGIWSEIMSLPTSFCITGSEVEVPPVAANMSSDAAVII